ncbi:MAG: homoserine kinase [Sutterella sp.]|nr:homoserine kinase [Sutterella sp.]MDD7427380.1 homoserine kinase [Sutterella sp.]
MAVFTQLTESEVTDLLREFSLGAFASLNPIASGIENTNYFLTTESGKWVLTVFERLSSEELPFYLELCEHLAKKGCRVARPQKTRNGGLFTYVHGKPVAIADCLPGQEITTVTVSEARSMGDLLAKMHRAVRDFPLFQKNLRGLEWWIQTAPKVRPFLNAGQEALLQEELERQIALNKTDAFKALTVGACHCDLFKNNALAEGIGTDKARVSGIFDFYFAGCSPTLFDLAVTMNDWCINPKTGRFIPELSQAFIDAYHAVNPLGANEKALWRDMLRAAALRFWLSRLFDFYLPRQAALLKPHDPTHFERVLTDRRTCTLPWPTEANR